MTPEYQGLSHLRCGALTGLLSRMDAKEDLAALLREADDRGVGGRFRSAIALEPVSFGCDLDEADRRYAAEASSGDPADCEQVMRPQRRLYRRTRDPTSRFTARQIQVLEMVAGGWKQTEIAVAMGTGRNNVASLIQQAKIRDRCRIEVDAWLAGLVAEGVIRPFEKVEEARDAS